MRFTTSIISYILLFFAIGCTPKIEDLSLYQKQFMPKSSYLPSKDQLSGKAPKIVVFSLDENGEVAKQADLGTAIANNIENSLTKNKLAQLVDRTALEKLKKEIQLAELNKTGSYKGPQVADYAISGSISNAGFTKKYSSGSAYFNPKDGTYVNIPPSFKYKAETSGNIKIYELPSMQIYGTIDFQGYASRTENVQQDGGFQFASLSIGGKQAKGVDRDDSLVRNSGEDAISSIEVELKNILSAKGYILEKRVGDDGVIFKVTLGSSNGIEHGDKVTIIGRYDTTNPITDEVETETRIVATGIISNIIQPDTSWIIVENEKKSQKVRLGDTVRLDYKRSSLSKLLKQSRKYIN